MSDASFSASRGSGTNPTATDKPPKPRKTREELIAAYRRKAEEYAARAAILEHKPDREKAKRMTRQKIIAGSMLLTAIANGRPVPKTLAEIIGKLSRDQDKQAFADFDIDSFKFEPGYRSK